MTTNLLSVIEQLVDALDHCMDAITERGLNGSPDQAEKWGLQLPLERAYAALAAGQQALEQTQGEAKSDLRGIDAGPFSEWLDLVRHGHVNRDECLIMVKDIPKWLKQNPQATEPAPSTDICQNCAGQRWEPSVYKGKVPCSFCHPAPSTAGELTLEQITRIYGRYGGDMVNCTRAIERELASARSQPTTEESSVVAGAQPVREPQK